MAVLGLVWAFTGGANLFMYQSAPLVLGYSYGYFTAKGSFQIGFYFDYSGGLFTSHRYVFLLAANRVELDQVTMRLPNNSTASHRR
jgi:hypothetical protein